MLNVILTSSPSFYVAVEIGKPIEVKKISNKDDITQEMIDELHAKFTTEMIRLFNSSKIKYEEHKNKELIIH